MEARPVLTQTQSTNQTISTIYSSPTPLGAVNVHPQTLFSTTHHTTPGSNTNSKPPISAFIKFIRSSISRTTTRNSSINNCANNNVHTVHGDNKTKSSQPSNTIVIPSSNPANIDILSERSNANNKGNCLKSLVRPNSVSSCSTSTSSELFCRFCQEIEPQNELVTPCLCSGTLKYIHQSCLQRWIKIQDNRFCEICKFVFHMKISTKPFKEWQKLEMNVMERRKIVCSVTFHVIALTCVIWSLYVLIDRTTEEMRIGHLEWPFWTKLIVVAIGFVGGVVFMYVQCRMYVTLCRKWHDYNRIFIVQNIPESELALVQARQKQKQEQHKAIVSTGIVTPATNQAIMPSTAFSDDYLSSIACGDVEANQRVNSTSPKNSNVLLQPTTSNSVGGSAPPLFSSKSHVTSSSSSTSLNVDKQLAHREAKDNNNHQI